jgi:hypothetical protein
MFAAPRYLKHKKFLPEIPRQALADAPRGIFSGKNTFRLEIRAELSDNRPLAWVIESAPQPRRENVSIAFSPVLPPESARAPLFSPFLRSGDADAAKVFAHPSPVPVSGFFNEESKS